MIDRNNYCKDCDRSIYASGALARSCDSNSVLVFGLFAMPTKTIKSTKNLPT